MEKPGTTETSCPPGTRCHLVPSSQDGGGLISQDGGSLIGRDADTAGSIAAASLLQQTDAPVISNDGASRVVGVSSGGSPPPSTSARPRLLGLASSRDIPTPVDLALDGTGSPAGFQPAFTGPMAVTGDYTQGPGAALLIGIAGAQSLPDGLQQFDQLVVGGQASFLGGRIVLGLFNPQDPAAVTGRFEPPVGATFDVVVARSVRVTGLTVRGPVWADGRFFRWSVVTRPDGLQALRFVVVKVPRMLVIRPAAAGLELAHATNDVGYRLESAPSAAPGAWSTLSTNPAPFVVKPTAGAAFYRLFQSP